MGNRAVIAFVNDKGKKDKNSVGIYLHWNGGRDSVEGFLKTAKDYGVRGYDQSYAIARLTQIIANYFGGTLSIGVNTLKNLDCDNYDNGVYWIDKHFTIVEREYHKGKEQKEYDLNNMVADIKTSNNSHFTTNQLI
tara:strand:+ start:105 stop:512 length:408 start_codon:yes stop_codon:yes gene_type:complete